MNDMGPNERMRLNKEVASTLGEKTKEAWDNAETKIAHRKAVKEFAKKSPAARMAWFNQEAREMAPRDINADPAAQRYQAMFNSKAPAMKSAFGENPNAAPFVPAGGKKTRKYKKSKRSRGKKSKAKKSQKKRASRKYKR